MSRGSGATARCVIEADEPSMKKRTDEKWPDAEGDADQRGQLRLGLRTRSRQTYLLSMFGCHLAADRAVAPG